MTSIQVYASYLNTKMRAFLSDERGDTNFISIIVVLGFVLVVAGIFIAFGSSIIDWVNDNLIGKSGLSGVSSQDNPLKDLKN